MKTEVPNIELVTIAVAGTPHNAHLLKTLLEDEGITVFLQDELMNQLYINAVGGIKIQISNTDMEKAKNLLIEGGFSDYLII